MTNEMNKSTSGIWFTEYHTDCSGVTLRIKETLYHSRSDYQEITVLDTYDFGKMLLLDNLIMLTEKDEFIYHEMITHIPVNIIDSVQNALIIGGGDCGTLRELTKYREIKSVKMVEIDKEVIDVSRKYFPELYSEKPNGKVIVGDGIKFIEDSQEEFDLIIVDSTDPIGPAEGLFNEKFYTHCANHMTEKGILTIQAESPYYYPNTCTDIYRNLKKTFKYVFPYLAYIPTYPSGMWQFMIAFNHDYNVNKTDNNRISAFSDKLKYYNENIHRAAFMLPNFVRKIYE